RERGLERAGRLLGPPQMLAQHRAELELCGYLLLGRSDALEQAREDLRQLRPRLALLVDSSQPHQRGRAGRLGVERILVGADRLARLPQLRLVDLTQLHQQLGLADRVELAGAALRQQGCQLLKRPLRPAELQELVGRSMSSGACRSAWS